MAREPGSSGLCLHPAGPHGRFPLPLPLALAILPSLTRDARDYTDNATSRIPSRILGHLREAVTRPPLFRSTGTVSTWADAEERVCSTCNAGRC